MATWNKDLMRFVDEPSEIENKQKSLIEIRLTKKDLELVWENAGTYSSLTQYVANAKKTYPKKPSKPLLKQGHSLDEAKTYVELLQSYEKDLVTYRQEKAETEAYNNGLDNLLEDYLMELSGVSSLSEKDQTLVFDFYWNNFSRDTLAEKYNVIKNIVDFVKQIKNS